MRSGSSLTTAEILAVFAEEVAARRGQVTDTFDDGRRLFTRSVLPHVKHVRPGDGVQGGVALKATPEEAWLYPYLLRLVCRNGAIMAQTLASRSITDLHLQEPDTALRSIREGVEACCAREVFTDTVRKVRAATEMDADLALNLLPLVSRLSTRKNSDVLSQIMDRFFGEADQSRFGLANAVTAVARDTRDPDLRWDLEEFGGGVAVGVVPAHPSDGARSARARSHRLTSVG
jgi:hypothetical protein